jgi:streptomycin 6-kinase
LDVAHQLGHVRIIKVIEVPYIVRNKAIALGAEDWLKNLSNLIIELEDRWKITLGPSIKGGTESYVAEAVIEDGSQAVLKLLIPQDNDSASNEIKVLQMANGKGCVELLKSDDTMGALLLERLGPTLHDLTLPIGERHEILCAAVEQLWQPAPNSDFQTGAEKGRWLIRFIFELWEKLNHPCSERVIDQAVSCAENRIANHDPEKAVIVHGDVHQWNALQASDGFKLVDPDGLLAEAEYDLGILMREDPIELLVGDPHERARWLARRCSLNATAIWEWGVVERVSTGLLCTQIDLQPAGTDMLTTAEQLAVLG